ncbi:hypothetical protein CK203_011142 [Vitis vinifera]|uniref:Uncharacterized protein n=1 Tax=Vitis vinifera TaxID=29760 RepID=A0A438JYG0_VITVI|nr:hypothetical protein CK203_011142 [Vitis vinifera]
MRPSGQIWLMQRAGRNQWRPVCMRQRMRWPGCGGEREELEADYQKQVDDTFIFGYRCCMKKNGIKRDVSSIPPGEEKKL